MPRPVRLLARARHLPPERPFASNAAGAVERRRPQNLVVAVRADGHVTSVSAAALELASAGGLRPLFVHVVPPPAVTVMPAPFAIPANAAAARLESETIEEARRTLARAGLDGTRVDVQIGDPARQVLEVARGHDTALLVLGMPPPVRFLRLARTVGQSLVRSVPCPMILVPPEWRAGPTARQRRAHGPTSGLTSHELVDLISSIGAQPVLVARRRASRLCSDGEPTDRLFAVMHGRG